MHGIIMLDGAGSGDGRGSGWGYTETGGLVDYNYRGRSVGAGDGYGVMTGN
jgi:hypothetical protein